MILGVGHLPRIRRVHVVLPPPHPLPQRVVVAGGPEPVLSAFLERLAAALDVPLVPLAELSGADEVSRLAGFDGWVTTAEVEEARPVLLDRAELVVVVLGEDPGSLRGLVRRTVRRLRADAAEPDLAWLDAVPLVRPELDVVRLVGPAAIEGWLTALA